MNILILALIVLVIVVMLIWAVDQIPVPNPFNGILKALIILIGALMIARSAGLL